MLPRLKFRHRINLLVLLAAIALVAVTAVTLVHNRRSERQLSGIEERYVPLLEIDRDLDRLFTGSVRALEDAAGAGEDTKLDEADQLSVEFLQHLAAGDAAIRANGGDPGALAASYRTYYANAREVAKSLVAGTPPGELADQIIAIQRARSSFRPQLAAATRPDRAKLAEAFATARESADASLRLDIIVATVALLLMAVVSWRMIRRMVSSLREVSAGVERIASGDFSRTIAVEPGDEIGDLAREANRTATRLQEQLAEIQRQARAAETANKELEAFSYSVSHDLRAPLRAIDGFSQALVEDEGDKLSADAQQHLARIRTAAQRMGELIDDLLRLSRVSRGDFTREAVDLTALATSVIRALREANPERSVEVVIADGVRASGDSRLLHIVLENLIGNAWKFTSKAEAPRIEFGMRDEAGERAFFVRDNGAGFDMKYATRLFGAFQRLHREVDFPGTGIGLATVQRIILRHGGRVWVEAEPGKGATFYFTLPDA